MKISVGTMFLMCWASTPVILLATALAKSALPADEERALRVTPLRVSAEAIVMTTLVRGRGQGKGEA